LQRLSLADAISIVELEGIQNNIKNQVEVEGEKKFMKASDIKSYIEEYRDAQKLKLERKLYNEFQQQNTDVTEDKIENYVKEELKHISITMGFCNVDQVLAEIIIEKSQNAAIEVAYEDLDLENAEAIVYQNESQIIDSILSFDDLSVDQMRYIIEKADLKEQSVKVQDTKKIEYLFTVINPPIFEIKDAHAEGLHFIVNLFEQQPIKSKSIGIVGFLAMGQITLGCLLFATPFGTTLISEGVGDLFYILKGRRNFTWQDYLVQKSISLSISLMTLGFGNSSKAVSAIETADQTLVSKGHEFIKNLKSGMQATKKGLMRIPCKQQMTTSLKYTGVKLLESGAKEIFNHGIGELSEAIIKSQEKEIRDKAESALNKTFQSSKINYAFTVDKFQSNEAIKNKIIQTAEYLLNPKTHWLLRQFRSVAQKAIVNQIPGSATFLFNLQEGYALAVAVK
jgi:hypothetical protein